MFFLGDVSEHFSQTLSIIDFPFMSANGFPSNLEDLYLAGITIK